MSYSYRDSLKLARGDEPVNTLLIRPIAGLFVALLYPTRITPNQVTAAALVAGVCSAVAYSMNTRPWTIAAALLLLLKDTLDSADGQLARARTSYSRVGRFLDSIGDLVVNALVFAALAVALSGNGGPGSTLWLCAAAFVGTTLRVSYHVYYHTSFLHLHNRYEVNRTNEGFRKDDVDPFVRRLQAVYLALYGWQDRMMLAIDSWCRTGIPTTAEATRRWFDDPTGLRLTGFLGLGTELFLLAAFSLAGALYPYLLANLIVMNCVWGFSVGYRRGVLRRRLRAVV